MPDMHTTHSETEKELLEYWDKHKIFERSVDERPKDKQYTFYDGPPFATGLPHYGHIVASVIKDVVPRFWTMRGHRVERRWGWDCHGLPIENIVEKQFDLKSRKDILAFGVDKFNESCERTVLTYVDEWKKTIRRMGRWVNMDGAYKTMDLEFMESIWWVFKQLWEKKYIYEGRKAMQICPRCETSLSNFEVAQGYADVTDISVTVAVTLTSGKYKGAKALVWTTTPWTLPGNALLAVNPNMRYEVVESDGVRYIVSATGAEKVFLSKTFSVIEKVNGTNLVGTTYEPIFPYFAGHEGGFQVVAADFVTEEEGTGIVHIAPGFGEDDMRLGEALGVKPIMHVGMNGQFVPEVAEPMTAEGYAVAGMPMKAKGAYSDIDVQIIKWLAHHDKLFAKEKITHSYPHCWRCDTPLLNYAAVSWFVRVADMQSELVKNNADIHWVPETMKEGRFGKWLEGARDWAISRSRFWGTPIPMWRAKDGELLCVGSRNELEELAKLKVENLHKQFVDKIVIIKDGKEFFRVPDVLDCWFESGSMPYAQLHYPFEHEKDLKKHFPAEFIAEGQDQTRGWFYTLHVLATALFQKPAFNNVIVNGIVLAEDGKKMSKRLNNYPDPNEVIEKYGADAIRFYLMSSPVVRAENLRFSESGVDEVAKKFVTIMRNVLSFYSLYAEHDDGRVASHEHVLDCWITARLNETLERETAAMEAYELNDAARVLQSFVTDLSTWYIRRSRDRVKVEGDDRAEALAMLRDVLVTFSKMLAPFMPFLAEAIYLDVSGCEKGDSVHLQKWSRPLPLGKGESEGVLGRMGEARAIVSRIMEARDASGRAVKQVLGSVTISVPSGKIAKEYVDVILDEVNVKKAKVKKGELAVDLDTSLTPELVREGMAREVIRRVNGLRKDAGLSIGDRIDVCVYGDDETKKMFDEHKIDIQTSTLAKSIAFGEPVGEHKVAFRVAEHDVVAGF